jgi:hypothetical protein
MLSSFGSRRQPAETIDALCQVFDQSDEDGLELGGKVVRSQGGPRK